METRYFCFSILLALLSAGISEAAAGADIYVPDDFVTIQEAIDSAVDGDTVIVRPGTYVENVLFQGKAITVKSSDGPWSTIIDGQTYWWSTVSFMSGEERDSVLDGFTVTNGYGIYEMHYSHGGGIYCEGSSPTLINNIITRNGYQRDWITIDYGGGIFCRSIALPYPSPCCPLIMNNTISDNWAYHGGGIYCDGSTCSPVIRGNTISGNLPDSYGGGIFCGSDSDAVITNNIIKRNKALEYGGGIVLWCSSPKITSCTVSNNSAYLSGGALFVHYNPAKITNSIIWNNSAPSSPEIKINSNLSASYCDIKGGWPGIGNIDADPLFVDPGTGDLHLTHGSPCRDAGDSLSPGLDAWDFEGDPRIHENDVDIGADEFHRHLYYTGYSMPGAAVEIKIVGPPGTSEVTLCRGSGIQDPPRPTQYGDLFLLTPFLARVSLGSIPAEGVLVYPATIPDSFVLGEHYPFQALIGPQAPGSFLTNLMVLTPHHPLPPLARRRW